MEYLKLLKDIKTITGIDITKKSRLRQVVEIKAIFCNIMRKQQYTYQKIGSAINMNHASIIHLLKVYDIIKGNPDVKRIENKLKLLNEGFNFEFLDFQDKIDELNLKIQELENIKINNNNEFFDNLFILANSNQFIFDKLVNFYNINSKLKF
jgi:hypothetical protein